MQIICNNCSNELTFPNRQVLVTCPHCYTHLQIEETDNTISATVVENPDLNNSLFMSLNQLTTIQSFTPLYNLLHLELEYNDAIEENFFRSVLVGKQFRPIFTRGLFRILIGLFFIVFFITPNVFNYFSIIFIAYSTFLVFVGIKEIIRFWRFRKFEKYYFEEQERLNEEVKNIDLSNDLKTWYFSYSKNFTKHLELREKYFYVNLFNRIKINIGTPTLSQGFRLLVIIVILVSFMISVEELMFPIVTIIMIAVIVIIIILFASIINKGNNHTSTYLTLLHHRKEIIEELKRHLQQ